MVERNSVKQIMLHIAQLARFHEDDPLPGHGRSSERLNVEYWTLTIWCVWAEMASSCWSGVMPAGSGGRSRR
jgi:hypothetical protein